MPKNQIKTNKQIETEKEVTEPNESRQPLQGYHTPRKNFRMSRTNGCNDLLRPNTRLDENETTEKKESTSNEPAKTLHFDAVGSSFKKVQPNEMTRNKTQKIASKTEQENFN